MLDFTKKPGSASLAFIISGGVWFALGTIFGLFSAVHLVSPEFFSNWNFNIPGTDYQVAMVFGRTRPMHVNTVIFGFIVSMSIGAALHYVPALLKTRLWSERLGWWAFLFWNLAVLSGPITFSVGVTHARAYAEYVWLADVFIMAALVLLLFNSIMTAVNRREKLLYVSVWYVFGTLIWTAGVFPIGNVMWHPDTGAMNGVLDSIFLWFYGHNLVGLLLTPMAVAAAYYVMPRITRTPLYSHTLSLVGFFTLVAIYTHIGGHHLLQTPIPNWLKTVSVVDSIAMFIPVFTVLANLWLTTRGKAGMLWNDPAGRFVLAGTLWYLVTCIQGPLQSLPTVQKITHLTQWTVGHAHIAVLGFAGFIALGAMWHVLPQIVKREIYSRRLVNLQFGLVMFGLVGFFLVLSMAGLTQGASWTIAGKTVYTVLPLLSPYMVLRAMLGLFIIASAFVGLYNLLMTVYRGKPIETPAPALEAGA